MKLCLRKNRGRHFWPRWEGYSLDQIKMTEIGEFDRKIDNDGRYNGEYDPKYDSSL